MFKMKKVLVIEDDPNIGELLNIHLHDNLFQPTVIENGYEGFKIASSENFDLIILDLMLPDMNGLEICRQLRAMRKLMPILVLTAKSEEIDKVLGLESGADDYLTKPFSIRELIARVKAIFRRMESISDQSLGEEDPPLQFTNLSIDLTKRTVTIDEQRVELTPKEFELLALLAKNPGRTYSRASILNKVWGYEFSGYDHTVNSHINRLRAKIEADLSNPRFVLTSWGVGYRFTDDLN